MLSSIKLSNDKWRRIQKAITLYRVMQLADDAQ